MHGCAALHRPLHTPIRDGLLLNCRAETVPAHRTAVTIADSNVDVTFLLMIGLLICHSNRFRLVIDRSERSPVFESLPVISPLGCNESAYACGGIGIVEDASATQNVGAG